MAGFVPSSAFPAGGGKGGMRFDFAQHSFKVHDVFLALHECANNTLF